MNWVIKETDANLQLMSEVLQISETTAKVMAHRGIRSKNAALSFLSPTLQRQHDTRLLKDLQKALERISASISRREKIMVFGDYDVDGITSTVIMVKTLQKMGANCEYYIPHRVEEGYGLNQNAVDKIAEREIKLLITVDNGISAIQEIAAAAEHGIDTVIIDHHEPNFFDPDEASTGLDTRHDDEPQRRVDILPAAAAIVDPKQADCEYPFKEMCAAGIVFKLAVALCEHEKQPLSPNEFAEMQMLAAIATLCDIVELVDENRILVTNGLAALNANKLLNSGLGSLITMRGYLEKPIDTQTVGFLIGPCLNATGRLKSAELAVELLLENEAEKRIALAQELIELNEARKAITAECVQRLMAVEPPPDKVLVLTDFEAHESVAGIVAGRIRDMTNRPTILLTKGDNAVKGSGRSISGYNLFEALYAHRELFTRFGGHALAAGLTLPEENIDPLRAALNKDCLLTDEDFVQEIQIDGELSPEEITLVLSEELARLAPFGKGNPEPLFVSRGLYAEKVRVINEKNTLIFNFVTKSNRRLKGIAFGLNDLFASETDGKTENLTMDAIYHIETNIWNGVSSVQIRLKDFKARK